MKNNAETLKSLMPLVYEIGAARAKFPANQFLMSALGEEIGELAEAWLRDPKSEATKKEALQVACVAMRIVTEGAPADGESLEVVQAMLALEGKARDFWASLPDRPDLSARS